MLDHPLNDPFDDRALEQHVAATLLERHYPAFRTLVIGVEQGSVTLSGTVRTFHERQVAVSISQQVDGVLFLLDQIEVRCESAS
jgi:osmotically-inducible protein OsmY